MTATIHHIPAALTEAHFMMKVIDAVQQMTPEQKAQLRDRLSGLGLLENLDQDRKAGR